MFLCARNVKPDDVETMLRLFLPRSRYGDEAREKERERWNRLWAHGIPRGIMMEDLSREGHPEAIGIMVAGLALPELHDRLASPGGPQLLDGLADAAERGEGPPDEAAVGAANAADGVDLIVCWIGYGEEAYTPGVGSRVVAAFQDQNAGYRLRRFTIETDSETVARRFETYGLTVLRKEDGRTVLSLHRDQALSGSDLSSQRFFSYTPPVLGFTPAQRAILLLARQGYTDHEIAVELDKTTDSVKKRWSGIYARFAAAFPGRLPEGREGSRGTEKRRTLLAYLRDRPEELRPYGAEERGKE